MARIIHSVMTEFGAVAGCGYSSEDAEVDEMDRASSGEGRAYFVAERDGPLLDRCLSAARAEDFRGPIDIDRAEVEDLTQATHRVFHTDGAASLLNLRLDSR